MTATVVTMEPVSTRASHFLPSTSTDTTLAGPTIRRLSWSSLVSPSPWEFAVVPPAANSLTEGTTRFPVVLPDSLSCSSRDHHTGSTPGAAAAAVVHPHLASGLLAQRGRWADDSTVVARIAVLATVAHSRYAGGLLSLQSYCADGSKAQIAVLASL